MLLFSLGAATAISYAAVLVIDFMFLPWLLSIDVSCASLLSQWLFQILHHIMGIASALPKPRCKNSKEVVVAYVPPPTIPPKHLRMINPSMANAIARGIKLKQPATFKQYPELVPKSPKRRFMTPLHYYGLHATWDATVHCIRYFHLLPLSIQEAEVAKAKALSTEQKRYLWQNRDRLMANRPPPLLVPTPPPKGISNRQLTKQLLHLTSLSSARCKSSTGDEVASKVIAAPCGDVFFPGPSIEISSPDNPHHNQGEGILCVSCGFASTSGTLKLAMSKHSDLDALTCGNCATAQMQA